MAAQYLQQQYLQEIIKLENQMYQLASNNKLPREVINQKRSEIMRLKVHYQARYQELTNFLG